MYVIYVFMYVCKYAPFPTIITFFSPTLKCPGSYPWGTRTPGWESLTYITRKVHYTKSQRWHTQ